MECEISTINTDMGEIKEILENTKTIAIVGLSPKVEKDSNKVGVYLQKAGFKIVPIYPKGDEILGEKVYRNICDVPFKIDMVDMFRRGDFASVLLKDIEKRGDIDSFWLQLGIVNNQAIKDAQKLGLKVVQNRCTKLDHKELFGNG